MVLGALSVWYVRNQPPLKSELDEALSLAEFCLFVLPLAVVPQIALGPDPDVWAYREQSLAAGDRDGLLEVVWSTQQPGDRWACLDDQVEAVRIVRSGARLYAYGAEALCGTPPVVAEVEVSSDSIRDILSVASNICAPAVVETADGNVLIDGGFTGWVLRAADTVSVRAFEPAVPSTVDLQAWVDSTFGSDWTFDAAAGVARGYAQDVMLEMPLQASPLTAGAPQPNETFISLAPGNWVKEGIYQGRIVWKHHDSGYRAFQIT